MDNKSHWNPPDCDDEERVKRVAQKVFEKETSSLWLVTSNEDFYGAIAALSEKRPHRYQDIDFLLITEEDLCKVGITLKPVLEGSCLAVRSRHFDITMDEAQAENLCRHLISQGQKPERCKKKQTISILEHQQQRGCKAVSKDSSQCDCETQLVQV
jgi:hypothetical protein